MPESRAVLFDIDGTLVDSNYLHVDAWMRGLETVGHPAASWRVHRSIGMDSEALLDDLLPGVDQAGRDAATAEHKRSYLASVDRLRPLPGARETVLELLDAGVRVVLATSAPEDELGILVDVLDLSGLVDTGVIATTNADDVDTAKPHPGIIQVALERGGADAADSIMVGDAVWDVVAAGRAGVPALAVRTGGIGGDELIDAGARRVADSVADLRDELLG
ncbi:HAD family hydrolase [Schumannella luteola]|uniref:Phosphoglycolate phosphatase-like HAD superfamily hydrolase n=1 Tax=Schumannella luteola TaxID=472059 RepID=A0A852YL33_9MICO|nr:phosphoglycolate phosphatase-like HAD superfamily hydrolase [Schumannella luteola]